MSTANAPAPMTASRASPLQRASCATQLMAAQHSVQKMAEIIGVDSLAFLTIDGLYRAVGEAKRNNELPQYCDACFSGEYPIALTDYDPDAAKGIRSKKAEKPRAA